MPESRVQRTWVRCPTCGAEYLAREEAPDPESRYMGRINYPSAPCEWHILRPSPTAFTDAVAKLTNNDGEADGA